MERSSKESRFSELSFFDQTMRNQGYQIIAGIDEAGRGPLAGPVVAAACILPSKSTFVGVDDSKKLTPIQRRTLFEALVSDQEVIYGIGIISAEEIDKINIYQATIRAMMQAISALALSPDLLLIDGMPLSHTSIPSQKVIRGDSKSLSIAAASIIAKETRDRLMAEFHDVWPMYGFDRHKGYGTPMHLQALEKYGSSPIHRRSFARVF
ncbi:MAG: ribonuclease HII [Parachlamydiaceae bacterium]